MVYSGDNTINIQSVTVPLVKVREHSEDQKVIYTGLPLHTFCRKRIVSLFGVCAVNRRNTVNILVK